MSIDINLLLSTEGVWFVLKLTETCMNAIQIGIYLGLFIKSLFTRPIGIRGIFRRPFYAFGPAEYALLSANDYTDHFYSNRPSKARPR